MCLKVSHKYKINDLISVHWAGYEVNQEKLTYAFQFLKFILG